jgi:hydroxyacylglutathione hydrolase
VTPAWLQIAARDAPSANMALVRGARPLLVDSGFGHDPAGTEAWLRAAGVEPGGLELVVNTHYHADHVGGNHDLQQAHGVPVAAHAWDATIVNARHPEACVARWLDQPVRPYEVDRALADGDVLDAGGPQLLVLHTPGHTLGHIALYEPEERVLLVGDLLHEGDVGWLNPFREGTASIALALASLERLAELGARLAVSGHGPPMRDPARAFAAAHARYTSWLSEPDRAAWHAVKRGFAYALMTRGGLAREAIPPFLLSQPWFDDLARHGLRTAPADLVEPLCAELVRAGAAEWRSGVLTPLAPHEPLPPGWPDGPREPAEWPSTSAAGRASAARRSSAPSRG